MKVCRQYHHHVVQRSVITGLTLFLLSLLAPLLSVWTKGPSKAQALVTPFASLIMTRRSVTLMSQSSLKNSLNEEINEESSRQIVEVCGFKDCKRAGGGPKLVKLFNEVSCCTVDIYVLGNMLSKSTTVRSTKENSFCCF